MDHVSVLKEDVQKYLEVQKGNVVVDSTLGLGGHAEDILERLEGDGCLVAFDQDRRNLDFARKRLLRFGEMVRYVDENFCHLKKRIVGMELEGYVDAILFDLGLSSPHVDEAERGFSFLKDGPLDMRYDQRSDLTAADVVNAYSQEALADIFWKYGEERYSKKIARAICEKRQEKAFERTVELAEFIGKIVPKKPGKPSKAHPATKVFQAIRMEVNRELQVLEDALQQAVEVLKVGGRVVIISYHSLEDRVVKHFFKSLQKPEVSPEEKIYRNYGDPIVEPITKKPIIPSDDEIKNNPRSRSAKLRAYTKIKNI